MKRLSVVVLLTHLWASTALCGVNADAKIAGHLQLHVTKGSPCTVAPAPPCNQGSSSLLVQGNLGVAYDLYLLVLDGDSTGVAGATIGIAYDGTAQSGMDVFGWTLCADSEYSGGPTGVQWPESGSGNMILWDVSSDCQTTAAIGDNDGNVTVALGSLYVYAYGDDTFSLTKRNYAIVPDFKVCGCDAYGTELPFPDRRGTVGFGTGTGVDPCY